MEYVNQLCEGLPESAKDLGLNLVAVIKSEHLSSEEVWAVALTASYFVRNAALQEAVLADRGPHIPQQTSQPAAAQHRVGGDSAGAVCRGVSSS